MRHVPGMRQIYASTGLREASTWVHAGDHVWGGAGQSTFRSWTQADFSLYLTPNIGCIQNTYPWLDMTAHANGTASGSVGWSGRRGLRGPVQQRARPIR